MKKIIFIGLVFIYVLISCSKENQDDQNNPDTYTTLTGLYLGQIPPGMELIPFAPNIIGSWDHAEVTFSPDGQEVYWAPRTAIFYSKILNGRWITPQIVSFSGQGVPDRGIPYDDVPVVSPDNEKLFFTSLRPIGYLSPNRENIWYVNRTNTGWSKPQPLPQIVNSTPGIHWQISVSKSGTLYFGAFQNGMKIFFSCFVNNEYSKPEPLTEINNFGDVSCPFIAPDESYIIFVRELYDTINSYISFKSANGLWLPPQLINQIKSSTIFVSRDGEYIFTSHQWISAKIIEDLRPE